MNTYNLCILDSIATPYTNNNDNNNTNNSSHNNISLCVYVDNVHFSRDKVYECSYNNRL